MQVSPTQYPGYHSRLNIVLAVQRFHADGATHIHAPATRTADKELPSRPQAVSTDKGEHDKDNVELEEVETVNQHEVVEMEVEQFEWREVVRGILDVQTWLTAFAYMSIATSLYSISLFL